MAQVNILAYKSGSASAKALAEGLDIKRLRKEGLSLANIKKEFDQRYNSTVSSSNPQKIDLLANRVAKIVKSTIHSFFEEET